MAATEDTRLVLAISADIASLRRAMKDADIVTKRTTDAVNDNFRKAGSAADRAAKQISGSMQNATRNLSFQFQDVTTSLLSGASPFTVMAQQAAQAGSAIDDLRRSGGLMKGIGSSLVGLVSPASLGVSAAILAFGYLTQEAMEFFSSTDEGSEEAKKAIKAQADELRAIRDRWKDIHPEVETYIEQLLEATNQTQKLADKQALIDKAWQPVLDITGDVDNAILDLTTKLENLGQLDAIRQLQKAQKEWRAEVDAGRPGLEQLKRLQDLITGAAKLTGISVDDLTGKIDSQLTPALKRAAKETEGINKAFIDMRPPPFAPPSMTPIPGQGGPVTGIIERQNEVYRREQMIKRGEEDAKAYRTGLLDFIAKDKPLSHITELEPEFQTRLAQFLAAAQEQAGRITITSGARTIERQAQLWQEALKKYGSPEAARKWVAPPGRSQHNVGRAADLSFESDAVKQWAHANAEAYGLVFRLENEAWHIELRREGQRERKKKSLQDVVLSERQSVEMQQQINRINADMTLTDEQRAIAIDKLTMSTKLLHQAEAEGIAITPQVRAEIERTATAYAVAEAAQRQLTAARKEDTVRLEEQKRQQQQFAEAVTSTAKTAFSGFVNDLRNGVEAGDAFRNMLDRVIDGMINMAIESMFAKNALGGLFGGGGGLFGGLFGGGQAGIAFGGGVGLYHGGGDVRSTAPMRRVSPLAFAGAPRLHNGLMPGEFPAILQKGELVIPKTARRGAGTVDNSRTYLGDVRVDVATGMVTASNDDARTLGKRIDQAVQAVLVRESRPGGLLRKVPS
ncbi:phage tail protein [Sinorhizobium medicae]|nr:phage tail protein [Sinorhizobium medicae]